MGGDNFIFTNFAKYLSKINQFLESLKNNNQNK